MPDTTLTSDAAPSGTTQAFPPLPTSPIPQMNSVDLFKGAREVSIKHGEEFYRLRLTKSGKLILHK